MRKLTKHMDLNIKGNAAELLNVWKGVVASEAAAVEQSKALLGESATLTSPASKQLLTGSI